MTGGTPCDLRGNNPRSVSILYICQTDAQTYGSVSPPPFFLSNISLPPSVLFLLFPLPFFLLFHALVFFFLSPSFLLTLYTFFFFFPPYMYLLSFSLPISPPFSLSSSFLSFFLLVFLLLSVIAVTGVDCVSLCCNSWLQTALPEQGLQVQ